MTPTTGLLTLIGITLVWGTSFVVVKNALDTIPVSLLLALRFSIAAALFAFVRFDRRAVVPALGLGVLAFVGFATQTIGLSLTTASKAAFITGLSVILTPLVAAVWVRRPIPPRAYAAAALAVVGLAFLTLGDAGWAGVNRGDAWVLLTALAYALYIVYLGEVAGTARAFALAGTQHLPMMLLAWAWAWPERGALVDVPLATYAAIAYLAVVATAIVSVLQTYAQRVVSAPLTALVFVLEPVFAALFAAWLLGERLGAAGWAGGAVVVLAMLVSEVRFPARRLPRR
ncbi:MAG: DMT family transporter [Trueperaceae bacterium]|nr:DMT family transporter [Trueperaceae bacterium]